MIYREFGKLNSLRLLMMDQTPSILIRNIGCKDLLSIATAPIKIGLKSQACVVIPTIDGLRIVDRDGRSGELVAQIQRIIED